MLNKSKLIPLICGGTSIIATILIYILFCDNIFYADTIVWNSLLLFIIAEAWATIKVLFNKTTAFSIVHIVSSLAHLSFVFVISLLFIFAFPDSLKTYWLLNILAFILIAVFDTKSFFTFHFIDSKNKELSQNRAVIDICTERAAALSIQYGQGEHKKALEDIVEDLKYSDNTCLTQDEATIMTKLDLLQTALENGDNEAITEKISDVRNIIKLRSIKVSNTKRGKY